MKSNIDFTLVGKDWNKAFWGYWILYLIFYIPNQLLSTPKIIAQLQHGFAISTISSIITVLAMVVLYPVYTVIFCKIIMPKISVAGSAFSFDGSISDLLKISIKGFFLSVLTLGIYLPWFIKNYLVYVANSISFKAERLSFLGKGSKLFVYILFSFSIPFAVFLVILFLFLSSANDRFHAIPIVAIFSFIVTILLCVPLTYLTYVWYVNVKWKNTTITLRTKLVSTCVYMLSQIMLTIITLGIYFPVAYIKIYAYFINRLSFEENGLEKTTLTFCGSTKKGFAIVWIQTLLSIVTLGFYLPWAYAKILRWFAESISIESSSLQEISDSTTS